jgi:hypothetical protein
MLKPARIAKSPDTRDPLICLTIEAHSVVAEV